MSENGLQVGGQVGGYRLVREVGRGATGVVFEARDPEERVVALKILAPPLLLSEEQRTSLAQRFLREARALAAVDHPNVVRVYGSGEASGHFYLAMEFVAGENLRQLLLKHGAFPPAQAVPLALQLCAALDAVHHAGIVHRDVKPENLIVLADGTMKLTDFGVAWMESEATLTRTGGVLGSPAYMSPEQILGRPVDRRSDLFAAAVTLYQLLADRLPFESAGLMELAHKVAYAEPAPLPPEVPYPLSRAVLQGLQKSPAARFATATEFAGALRATQSGRFASPVAAPAALEETLAAPSLPGSLVPVMNGTGPCARHPRRPALGHCRACGRALCAQCARTERPPYFCYVHAPVTLFGISTVRLEVLLTALAFLFLLLCLSPLGYAAFRR
jgi:serine/threonine-protein kinase